MTRSNESGVNLPPSSLSRPETLSRQAYSTLRVHIRDGGIAPGQLYSETQIADMLGMSRTPVREALIELAREGVIEKLPQRGFRLREITAVELTETFVIRELLESYVVEVLAESRSADDIAVLREVLRRQEINQENPERFFDIDEDFHLGLASLAGLDRVRHVLLTVRGINWISGLKALRHPHRISTALSEHKAIVDLIELGDAERAVEAVHIHIVNTAKAGSPEILDHWPPIPQPR